MNFSAVESLLAPLTDARFEASLRRQLADRRQEDSVTLEEVGLQGLAYQAIAERGAKGEFGPAEPA